MFGVSNDTNTKNGNIELSGSNSNEKSSKILIEEVDTENDSSYNEFKNQIENQKVNNTTEKKVEEFSKG